MKIFDLIIKIALISKHFFHYGVTLNDIEIFSLVHERRKNLEVLLSNVGLYCKASNLKKMDEMELCMQ